MPGKRRLGIVVIQEVASDQATGTTLSTGKHGYRGGLFQAAGTYRLKPTVHSFASRAYQMVT